MGQSCRRGGVVQDTREEAEAGNEDGGDPATVGQGEAVDGEQERNVESSCVGEGTSVDEGDSGSSGEEAVEEGQAE